MSAVVCQALCTRQNIPSQVLLVHLWFLECRVVLIPRLRPNRPERIERRMIRAAEAACRRPLFPTNRRHLDPIPSHAQCLPVTAAQFCGRTAVTTGHRRESETSTQAMLPRTCLSGRLVSGSWGRKATIGAITM